MAQHLAIHGGDGFREWNPLRTHLHAILRVVAIFDATRAHQSFQALGCVHGAGRVHIEQAYLADDGRADKLAVRVHLWANFQAASATDAIR